MRELPQTVHTPAFVPLTPGTIVDLEHILRNRSVWKERLTVGCRSTAALTRAAALARRLGCMTDETAQAPAVSSRRSRVASAVGQQGGHPPHCHYRTVRESFDLTRLLSV